MAIFGQFIQQARAAAAQWGAQLLWQETETYARTIYQDAQSRLLTQFGRNKRKADMLLLEWEALLATVAFSDIPSEMRIQLADYFNSRVIQLGPKKDAALPKQWSYAISLLVGLGTLLNTNAPIMQAAPPVQVAPPTLADELLPLRRGVAELQQRLQAVQTEASDASQTALRTHAQQLERLRSLEVEIAQQRDHWATAYQNRVLIDQLRSRIIEADDALMLQFQMFAHNLAGAPPLDPAIATAVWNIDQRLIDVLHQVGGLTRIAVEAGMRYDEALMVIEGVVSTPTAANDNTVAMIISWGYLVRAAPQAPEEPPVLFRKARVRVYRFVGT